MPSTESAPVSEPLIAARSVAKSFGGVQALVHADIELRRGEIHGVIGENGSGKSTLLRIVAGQIAPDNGAFHLEGRRLDGAEVSRLYRREVALVSQELSLADDLSVGENIILRPKKPGGRFRIDWRGLHEEAREVLRSLGVDIDTRRKVSTLSLGRRQLVEIARVIAQRSPVMILDEPTSALSDEEVEPLFSVLRQLRAQGKSIVIVTHRMDELLSISDRLTVLRDGHTVAAAPRADFDRASLIKLMLGHEPELYEPVSGSGAGRAQPVLQIHDLQVPDTEGGVRPFEVREREVVGLFGLAGAGCSTVVQRIAGRLSSRDLPAMTLHADHYRPRGPVTALRRGVGYVPEDRASAGLVSMMSISDNIHLGAPGVANRLRRVNRRRESALTDEHVDALRIRRSSNKAPVRGLSGGNQQKVLLAKALASEPRLLVLEEPTRGVDIGAKDEIHRILHRLRDEGMSLLVVSTDIEEMLLLCDRFYVMREGRMAGELTRAEATQARLTHLATSPMPVTELTEGSR